MFSLSPELIRFVIAGTVIALFYANRRALAEAIDDFWNNGPRGGPRTPMHPSPSSDAALLQKKRMKKIRG